MLKLLLDAKIIDVNGEVEWTEIKLQASDDPNEDWIDVAPTGCEIGLEDNLVIDPTDLRRALDLLDAERALHLAA